MEFFFFLESVRNVSDIFFVQRKIDWNFKYLLTYKNDNEYYMKWIFSSTINTANFCLHLITCDEAVFIKFNTKIKLTNKLQTDFIYES